jgi:hypothetical protein
MDMAVDMKEFAQRLRAQVEEFLARVHEDNKDEFRYFIERIEPGLGLIDRLAAQRLLVRAVAYDLTKRIIAEQLPEELLLEQAPEVPVPEVPVPEAPVASPTLPSDVVQET